MAQVSINFRVDNNLKKEFSKLCDEMGLSITSAFTTFMKMTIKEQGIPFEIKVEKKISKENVEKAFEYLKKIDPCDKQEEKEIIELLDNLEEDKEISSRKVIEL